MIDNLLDIKLHSGYLIRLFDLPEMTISCNDECELFENVKGEIVIHPNEDEEYFADQVSDIYSYNEETFGYTHIYHKNEEERKKLCGKTI